MDHAAGSVLFAEMIRERKLFQKQINASEFFELGLEANKRWPGDEVHGDR
jgi:hypothetical protein